MNNYRFKLQSLINFLLVLLIPLASVFFVIGRSSFRNNIIGLSSLTVAFCVAAISHSSELLALKKLVGGIYIIVSIIGYLIFLLAPFAPSILGSIIILAMGTAALLIPGEFRFILFIVGRFRRKEATGLLEGISLFFVRIPWEAREILNSVKYSIYSYPWKAKIKNLIDKQIVVSLLYGVVRLSHTFTEVAVNRDYHLETCPPRVAISKYERFVYAFCAGILIVLKILK